MDSELRSSCLQQKPQKIREMWDVHCFRLCPMTLSVKSPQNHLKSIAWKTDTLRDPVDPVGWPSNLLNFTCPCLNVPASLHRRFSKVASNGLAVGLVPSFAPQKIPEAAPNHWPPKRMDGLSMFKSGNDGFSMFNGWFKYVWKWMLYLFIIVHFPHQIWARASQIQLVLGITVSLGAHIDGDVLKSQRSVFQRPTVSFREIQTWVMAGWLSNGGQQKLGIQTRPRRMEIWLINPSKWLLLVNKPFQFFLAYQLGPLGIIVAG